MSFDGRYVAVSGYSHDCQEMRLALSAGWLEPIPAVPAHSPVAPTRYERTDPV